MLPNQTIRTLIGRRVRVELKSEEITLVGRLESMDDCMNLYLSNTVEYRSGEKIRGLGNVVLR